MIDSDNPNTKHSEILIKDFLKYDETTGLFYWIKKPRNRTNIGAQAGCKKQGYILIKFKGKTYFAHRLAWLFVYGRWPSFYIDHINGVTDDNRISNLRDVSLRENQSNRKMHRSGKLLGANFHKQSNKWISRIRLGKKQINIGIFRTDIEAHKAYLKALESIEKTGKLSNE